MDIKPVHNPEHFRNTIVNYIDKYVKNEIYSKNIEKCLKLELMS